MRIDSTQLLVTDVHCHMDRLDEPVGAATRAAASGIRIFYVTFLPSDYESALPQLGEFANVTRGLGFHPMASRGFFPWVEGIDIDRELELFREYAEGAAWIGEIGLDYTADGAPYRRVQERMLDTILSSPTVPEKFMTVHSRDAVDELIGMLLHAGASRVAVHANGFTGGVPELEKVLEAGFSFSIVPSLFHDDRGRSLVAAVPRDRVLLETDAPFGIVAGEPLEPADLTDAVARLADAWNATAEEVASQLEVNVKALLEPKGSQ